MTTAIFVRWRLFANCRIGSVMTPSLPRSIASFVNGIGESDPCRLSVVDENDFDNVEVIGDGRNWAGDGVAD